MKKNRGKAVIIVLCVLLSLYFLYPTYKDYSFTKNLLSLAGEDSAKFVEENENAIRTARMERIKLGLDLQGGMRVVLEVNLLKLLEDLAKNKDDDFNQVVLEVRNESRVTEVDLIERLTAGFQSRQIRMSKYYGSVRDDDAAIISKLRTESNNAVDRAMEIVRNRVDQYGVSEPSIQKQGGRRIIVELPGVSKEAEVRQLLQGTALLEFKLLIEPEILVKLYDAIDKTLAGKPLDDTTKADTTSLASKDDRKARDTTTADTSMLPLGEEQLAAEEELAKARKEHPFFVLANPFQQENREWNGQLYSAENDRQKVLQMLQRPDVRRLLPNDIAFLWSAKPEFVTEGKKFFSLYAVKGTAELTGGVVTGARATIDPNFNTPIVTMQMNTEGAREWARITGANINKRLAIIMDNAIFSAPVVRSKITGGNSQIEGMDNVEEAKLLEIVLKAGALPAPVEIIQQTSVGPSLGEDSIRSGVSSSLLALLLTIAFMIFYYKMGGTMADVALVLNMLFTMAVIAGFKGTLTLPGIAGIILTMAVAVDANVLIYERIREEAVTGKTMSAILEAGYGKAFTAIFDSNVTTFITGVILYQFGSGPIQGFALTLMIGIVASMFSAIVITRVIFEWMNERGMKLNFG